jgi:hypothetical protein
MTAYTPEMDAKLAKVEEMLAELALRHGLLTSATRTRWRWDEPSVLMTWTDRVSAIGRNLQVTAAGDSRFAVEVNAWKDFDDQQPRRRWKHVALHGEYSLRNLPAKLSEAFEDVMGWKAADLANTSPRRIASTPG